jgi:hypothetical protein
MWFNRVKSDMSSLPDMVEYFNAELDQAYGETKINGSLEKLSQDLPGIVSHRFAQLQEIEAVLKYLEIQYGKTRSDHYRKYLERYARELTDRSIEKYLDGEQDIIDMSVLINEIALVRNKYLAIMKGLEVKGYQLNNIVKLRAVGLNDSVL